MVGNHTIDEGKKFGDRNSGFRGDSNGHMDRRDLNETWLEKHSVSPDGRGCETF